tara:strand:- start:348 stop:998 length:651 start_codon:yes stop_codon:yes gene_type:complete
MKFPVVPAIIPNDYESLLAFLRRTTYASEIQIDVVDGKFTPTISWPYAPEGKPKEITVAADRYTLEIDLMVENPVAAALAWEQAGADMLVFHVESLSLDVLKNFANKSQASIGVACHGATDMELFLTYAAVADYVQLMGIAEIGKQAQPFDSSVLDKIRIVHESFPEKMISIDGSVNPETIQKLAAAGANRFVAGSAIVGQPDEVLAYQKLAALVN